MQKENENATSLKISNQGKFKPQVNNILKVRTHQATSCSNMLQQHVALCVLASSQTLYFLFKVCRALVLTARKQKHWGIY